LSEWGFRSLGLWEHGIMGAWDFGSMQTSTKCGIQEIFSQAQIVNLILAGTFACFRSLGLWEHGIMGAWNFGSM
jgi:hypothetical protein